MDKLLLIKKALEAREKAYAPYSDFLVGAAVLADDDTIYTGCNIENASYGGTVCAERTSIFKGVSEGKTHFKAIAIVGGVRGQNISSYAFPCGICRQVMREFSDPKKFVIIVAKSKEDYKEYTLEQLLPDSFGPDFKESN